MRALAMLSAVFFTAATISAATAQTAAGRSKAVLKEAGCGSRSVTTKFDYVIILAYNDMLDDVDTLKSWKQQLGYSVKIVTVDEILALYSSGDAAERIWSFLHDRYRPDDWAIRYVLLVGDLDSIPMRMLYADDEKPAYGSDYYYANLDQMDWDLDNDDRWGEFDDDNLDTTPEVIVGRIPIDEGAAIRTICENIIAFEQDSGPWKRNALLAHGIMDYTTASKKSDQATLAELLKTDFFDPLGWTTSTLYEKAGIAPSSYAPDDSLCRANYESMAGPERHGVVSCNAHGNIDGFASYLWVGDWDGDGKWDPDGDTPEKAQTNFGLSASVDSDTITSIMMLTGCNTGAIVNDEERFAASNLRSRYLIMRTRHNTLAELYLRNGAPAVMAPSAGGDYSPHYWTGPTEICWNTLSYHFFEHLVDEDKRAGDAFFEAQVDYAAGHKLRRGIRDFNFFGDPSLRLKGIRDYPGGLDRIVYEGSYQDYAADNDDNGDMYVSVVTTDQYQSPGIIEVYRSSDHGENWHLWTAAETEAPVRSHDILVSRHQNGTVSDDRLHVFASCENGDVCDIRIQLADSSDSQTAMLPAAGRWAVHVSAARDPQPMPAANTIYAAWEYNDWGTACVRLACSTDNGATWTSSFEATDRFMPALDAGPAGRVYLSTIVSPLAGESDVVLVRSTDHGSSFGMEVNLTPNDGSLGHHYASVGASTHAGVPSVWVAYDYHTQSDQWGPETDLRFACSRDGGETWVKNRVLSADVGVDEGQADLEGYRATANQYMNIAYNYDRYPEPDPRRKVIWRYANGSRPRSWSYHRVENDRTASAPEPFPPRLVYSPGAGPGSGVVYGGADRHYIYFSAPWLSGPSAMSPRAKYVSPGQPAPRAIQEPDREPATFPAALVWCNSGELEGATVLSSIMTASNGDLIAAGAASTDNGQSRGAVYRSTDQGQRWERLADPAGAWSIGAVTETSTGALLAGGFAVYDLENVSGAVWRSENGGVSWDLCMEYPGGMVSDLLAKPDGTIIAGTGWNGELWRSSDDGVTWSSVMSFGPGVVVHDIIRAGPGNYLAALEGSSAPSAVMKSADCIDWRAMEGLGGVSAAYEIALRGDEVIAGVTADGRGAVYMGGAAGNAWFPLPLIPADDVTAVRSLAAGPDECIIAGTVRKPGPSDGYVFALYRDTGPWSLLGGTVDLATGIYDIETTGSDIFAATGWVHGNVYRCSFDALTGVSDDLTDVTGDPDAPQTAFGVLPNYPNPFNPLTVIPYYLRSPGPVTIAVYDINGRRICTIKDNVTETQGWHTAAWDGKDERGRAASSGVYFYRLGAGRHTATGKLTLIR